MRAILTLALILWTGAAHALCSGPDFRDRLTDADRADVAAAVAATPYPTGLLWQATKGRNLLTLIGTIHIYDPALVPIANGLAPIVQEADLLLVEAGPTEQAAMQAEMTSNPGMMFIEEGPTLPERLDAATWEAAMDAARARSIPPFLAAKMQPWFLALSLSIPPCVAAEMAAGRAGLDGMLMDVAADARTPIASLEPWTTLFDALRAGTPDEQIEFLRLSLLAPDLQSEMFVTMLDSYFAEEVAAIWEISRISSRYVAALDPAAAEALFAETEAMLLTDRNRAWMAEIALAATTADHITIAVGAAHLPGEAGLLNLLAQDGWTLTRLNLP